MLLLLRLNRAAVKVRRASVVENSTVPELRCAPATVIAKL